MALTSVERQKQYAAQNGGGAYRGGLQGLSDSTASALGAYQAGYHESDAVANARKNLQSVLDRKPGEFQSRYQGTLDNLLGKITNPEKFSWNFNGDEMFKYWADLYGQKGKQAMQDTVGQMSALTGGYGNSYAERAGQQAYDDWMTRLFEKGDQLRQEAYQRHQDERADTYSQYGAVGQAENQDYGRYRDAVGDWQTDRGYYTDVFNNERNFDYGDYMNMLNYFTGLAGQENSDYWNKMNYDAQMAQWEAEQALAREQFDAEQMWKQMQWDDAHQPKSGGGGGSGKKKTTTSGDVDLNSARVNNPGGGALLGVPQVNPVIFEPIADRALKKVGLK